MGNAVDHRPEAKHVFWPGRLSALVPMVLFLWFLIQLPAISQGAKKSFVLEWVPSMGVAFTFVLDGLSNLFALIITGIGTLVLVYADAYMAGRRRQELWRFYAYLNAFLLAMLGIVLSDNLIGLFVFWELTTVFSFLLIGFEHNSEASRNSARQALLVTGAGGLVMLVGILLVGRVGGSYGLTDLTAAGDVLRRHALYLPILICMLAGAFTKSAQLPFHFWLPDAMKAPTPISAFLHSATMVKAGIYLMARLHPILGGTQVWMTTLVLVGAATAVWGALVSLGQTDLKRVLAHTTIMALGIITMFLGGQTTPALTAAVTFLLVHALYKSALFLVVGNIDHQTGTRQLGAIRGLGRSMPFTAAAAGMAALSMAGFPLFFGFIGKEIMYKGALTEEVFPELATTAALVANAMMVAVSATLALRPFYGAPPKPKAAGESPWRMWLGPLVLSGLGLVFGLIPDRVAQLLVQPAVLAFHATTENIQLKLYHGINEPLLLSILTLVLGVLLYLGRRKIRMVISKQLSRLPLTAKLLYGWTLDTTLWVGGQQTRVLQNGSLLRYLMVIIVTVLISLGWALTMAEPIVYSWKPLSMNAWQAVLVALMLISVVAVVRSISRLLAICALGVIGAGVALIFLSYGAPDVALTQLLVETLTLIFAAIILLRLPNIDGAKRHGERSGGLRLLVALGSGVVVSALLLGVNSYDIDRTITAFYEQRSFLEAHGRNIVNVILVDFRSLDTLGEIIVVAASALAAISLIRGRRPSL